MKIREQVCYLLTQRLNQAGALFPNKDKNQGGESEKKIEAENNKIKPQKKKENKKEKGSFFNFTNRYTIALDIGSNSIKVVKVQNVGNQLRLLNYNITTIPAIIDNQANPLNLNNRLPIISNILSSMQTKKGSYIISIGGPSVVVRQIKLPRLSEKELKSSLRLEAKSYIPFPIEEVEMESQILDPKKPDHTMKVLLVAIKKELLNEVQSSLSQINIEPNITDVNSLALMNTFFFNESYSPDETIVLVDIGAQITTLNIYRENGVFFTRDIPIAGNRFTKEIETKLNVSYQQAEDLKKKKGNTDNEVFNIVHPVLETLIREVRRSLTYYENQSEAKGFSRVLLTGGGANIEGITKYFSEELQLPVSILDCLKKVTIDTESISEEALKEVKSQLALAIGLATRG
ncbi:MAG: type IV pilus assembly protein PilM [bacterium]